VGGGGGGGGEWLGQNIRDGRRIKEDKDEAGDAGKEASV